MLSQWFFVTPNMKEYALCCGKHDTNTINVKSDGHDTGVAYAAQWLNYWLIPLLSDANLLTFDENASYNISTQIYTILLSGAVPSMLKGTTDDTFYTHYSMQDPDKMCVAHH